jgi:hypothetical protein
MEKQAICGNYAEYLSPKMKRGLERFVFSLKLESIDFDFGFYV